MIPSYILLTKFRTELCDFNGIESGSGQSRKVQVATHKVQDTHQHTLFQQGIIHCWDRPPLLSAILLGSLINHFIRDDIILLRNFIFTELLDALVCLTQPSFSRNLTPSALKHLPGNRPLITDRFFKIAFFETK